MSQESSQVFEKTLTPKDVATEFNVSQQQLLNLRKNGNGPAFFRVGNLIRYSRKSLNDFIQNQQNGNCHG